MAESIKDRLLMRLAPPVAYAYIRFLRATMRIEFRDADVLAECREAPGNYILAFWHSRFVLMPFAYPGSRMMVLSSFHRDARMLAEVLARFGLGIVRGSSSKGGAGAIRGMIRRAREGHDLGVTPDGPRGPRRRVKEGVVAIARLTGLPIVPVTYSAAPARRFRSWDLTLLPGPFSRAVFRFGRPIRIPRNADGDEQERLRSALEQDLDRLTDLADRETGIGPEPARPAGEAG